jgi:ATP-dependent DNA helicase DinG
VDLALTAHEPEALGLDAASLARLCEATGPFAIVDLETTGLQTVPGSEILEVGCVLVDPGESRVRTASRLVRPEASIPRIIQHITGIGDDDVMDAPPLSELRDALARLLEGRAIVAHNAEFERHFLSRAVAGWLADAPYLDTQDLLSVTHPDAPDLRLESFTRDLLGTEERHRALDDALDTGRVMSRVGVGARSGERRYAEARSALSRFAPDSPWLALLGKDGDGAEVEPRPAWVEVGESAEPPVPFDEEAIAAALADEARGRRHFPGYRVREPQVRLAREFARNLRDEGVLLIEGGTGVGKSLAYLAAAIPFALERAAAGDGAPVVISTRTKLLQDQLLGKDIPAAARFLGHPGLRALSIKGRANYVCERRLVSVLAEGSEASIFPEDRLAYATLAACAGTRPFGEVGTVPAALLRRFPPLRDLLRRSVAARAEQCSREQCAQHEGCPFGAKRRALAGANLVVANHDLLLRWPPDYPAFAHCIVDEVHELADVADDVYAQEVRPEAVLDRIDDVFGRPGEKGRRSALAPAGARRTLAKDALAWRRGVQQDLAALGKALGAVANDFGEVDVPLERDARWNGPARAAGVAADRIDDVAGQIARLADDVADDDAGPLRRAAGDLRDAAAGLRRALLEPAEDAVAGFERVEPPWDRWRLAIRTVSLEQPFDDQFLSRLASFTGVSASVFIGGNAFASLGELGVESRARDRLSRVSVPSPFDYPRHMRVVAYDRTHDLVEDTATAIETLARRLGGRTLGLFTSLARMNQVASILSERLRDDGIEVLAPRRAADDPHALVARFRDGGPAVLLGARKFWQGLDIPGDRLQAVVIEKLPFEVPTELRKRRQARLEDEGMNVFARHTMGKMLLNLKQMVGRLIRSEDDRGVAVIVEGRTDKRYFARLAEALPPDCAVEAISPDDLERVLGEVGIGAPSGGAEATT